MAGSPLIYSLAFVICHHMSPGNAKRTVSAASDTTSGIIPFDMPWTCRNKAASLACTNTEITSICRQSCGSPLEFSHTGSYS